MFKKMLKNYREKKRIKQNISEVKKQTNHSVNIVTKISLTIQIDT